MKIEFRKKSIIIINDDGTAMKKHDGAKAAQKTLGLTTRQLADKLGISRSTVESWAPSHPPSRSSLFTLSGLLREHNEKEAELLRARGEKETLRLKNKLIAHHAASDILRVLEQGVRLPVKRLVAGTGDLSVEGLPDWSPLPEKDRPEVTKMAEEMIGEFLRGIPEMRALLDVAKEPGRRSDDEAANMLASQYEAHYKRVSKKSEKLTEIGLFIRAVHPEASPETRDEVIRLLKERGILFRLDSKNLISGGPTDESL